MKIDYAIMSSNDNPMYLDFWEPVAKCWEKLGITPILFYFGDKTYKDDRVIKMKIEDVVPECLQTQWVRFYAARILEPNKTIVTSDIDMIPLSKFYFVDQLKGFTDTTYAHLNPCIETYGRIPCCYHVARNDVMTNVLKLNQHADFRSSLAECFKYRIHSNGWFAEENYTTKLIFESGYDNTAFIKRDGGQNGHRIDRTDNDTFINYDLSLIPEGYYYDCHSIRPYEKHKGTIDKIISKFLEG